VSKADRRRIRSIMDPFDFAIDAPLALCDLPDSIFYPALFDVTFAAPDQVCPATWKTELDRRFTIEARAELRRRWMARRGVRIVTAINARTGEAIEWEART
jgi:hypothetical protein